MSTPNPHAPRIPKAVQAAAALAEAHIAEVQQHHAAAGDPPPEAGADVVVDTPAGELPPAAPQGQEPAPAAPTPAAAAPQGDAALLVEIERLKGEVSAKDHRISVLDGMNRRTGTEVAELRSLNEELNDSVVQLTQRLGTRGGTGAAASAAAPTPSPTDEADAETVGPEALAVMKRVAQEAAVAEATARVKPVVEQQQRDAYADFVDSVAKEVPDFEACNVDPRFQQFMASTNPTTGEPYGEGLNRAVSAGRAPVVVNLYKAYKASIGQAGAAAPTPTPKPLIKPLNERVAPTGASTAVPTATAGAVAKRNFTESEVSKLLTKRAIGGPLYGQALKEWEALAAEIDLASAEGRIRKG